MDFRSYLVRILDIGILYYLQGDEYERLSVNSEQLEKQSQ